MKGDRARGRVADALGIQPPASAAWRQRAACRPGAPGLEPGTVLTAADIDALMFSRGGDGVQVCARCPVAGPCGDDAMLADAGQAYVHGVRGGLTAAERRELLADALDPGMVRSD